jgi:phage baseplate assembly protein W
MPTTLQPYGVAYPIAHGPSGFFNQTYSILEQIKTNMMVLLRTKKGERRMYPTFGSGMWSVLFENGGDELSPIIESTIRKDVGTWMPYVTVKGVSVNNSENDSNALRVFVTFTVPTIGVNAAQTLEVTMNTPIIP